jgi:hypothetical protein
VFTCLFCDLSKNFVKMARLFSHCEYIDIVLVYGEVCGSAPRAQRLLMGVHEELGIFGLN